MNCRSISAAAKARGWSAWAPATTEQLRYDTSINVHAILKFAKSIVEDEGFVLHPDKIRVMRKGNRQEVTGIVVNDKLGIDRKTLKKFRALLHQIELDGFEGKTWGNGNIRNTIQGYANFVAQVKPEQGAKLKAKVKALLNNPNLKLSKPQVAENKTIIEEDTKENIVAQPKTETDALPWWRLW